MYLKPSNKVILIKQWVLTHSMGKLYFYRTKFFKNLQEFYLKWLNQGIVPKKLKEGRLLALSKTGSKIATAEDSRIININSHLTKIFEKAILAKINSSEINIF